MLKTKLEIIDETVEFYSKNPRSLGEQNICVYRGPNGSRCAFSRCMKEEFVGELIENKTARHEINRLGWNILKDQYHHESIEFWSDLQSIHDIPSNWDGQVLTKFGQEDVKIIKRRYSN